MTVDFSTVTEMAHEEVTAEQVDRLANRYYWAGQYCRGKDVLEVACGSGQGLGYLSGLANSLEAGDLSSSVLSTARKTYQGRMDLIEFDALNMPFEDSSKDVIILFEAIYYLPDAKRFVDECRRVLRPGGSVLLATANKDLYDFNPSPHSYIYYGIKEFKDLFPSELFELECFGYLPVTTVGWKQKIFRPLKKIVVSLGLMPKTMSGKKFLKSLIFGKLVEMPAEIDNETSVYDPPVSLSLNKRDSVHKVLYCHAQMLR